MLLHTKLLKKNLLLCWQTNLKNPSGFFIFLYTNTNTIAIDSYCCIATNVAEGSLTLMENFMRQYNSVPFTWNQSKFHKIIKFIWNLF